MSFMSDQHGVVGDSILLILNSSPGIDGMSLVAAVQADLQSNPGAEEYVKTVGADEIFAVADDLQGTGAVWLDEEEDAWKFYTKRINPLLVWFYKLKKSKLMENICDDCLETFKFYKNRFSGIPSICPNCE